MRASTRRCIRLARLTAAAWLGLAAYDLSMRAGFARLHDRVRRIRTRAGGGATAVTVDDVVWAVDEACVWYVKRVACLQRSVVTTRLLRRHGVRAELVIGCRPLPFESHAWVEVAGLIVNDRPQYQKCFAVLDRL